MAIAVDVDETLIAGLSVICSGLTGKLGGTPCQPFITATRVMEDTLAVTIAPVTGDHGWRLWVEIDPTANPATARVCRYLETDDYRRRCFNDENPERDCATAGMILLHHLPVKGEDVAELAGTIDVAFADGLTVVATF